MNTGKSAILRQKIRSGVKKFLIPEWNLRTAVKLAVLLVVSTVFFTVFRPCIINGESMLPTYRNRKLVFCNTLRYLKNPPQRGDVVVIKYVGSKYLLKRLVALEGDTVGFTDGRLIVNGETVDEPYVRFRGSWNLEPVTVAPGKCFVVGDNRGQPAYEHLFGEVDLSRIIGGLLF
ncbi:MAG: signal peptidase I [Lentisphaeria bacterium]|nr:signal peptidase I [Lentisphaeria bacterium]